MEKYGFVYIWYDRKHKRYYIGAHWGTEGDDYICSSMWMMQAYRKRPQDFKRRILERVYTSKKETFKTEQNWLNLIKEEELRGRYYNLYRCVSDYWNDKGYKNREIAPNFSAHITSYKLSLKKKGVPHSEAHKIARRKPKSISRTEDHRRNLRKFIQIETPNGVFDTVKEAAKIEGISKSGMYWKIQNPKFENYRGV